METMEKIKRSIDNGRQFRSMVEFRANEPKEDTDELIVEGYATTFNDPYELYRYKDYEGVQRVFKEQLDEHSFDECDMSDVIMQYDHNGRVFARTRNNTLTITPDEHGLLVRADLSKSAGGKDLYQDIKNKIIDRMSFAFTVNEDDTETATEDGCLVMTRTIKRIGKLYDVSAVSIPANDGTDISARSYCDGVIAELEEERSERMQKEAKKKKIELELMLGGNN